MKYNVIKQYLEELETDKWRASFVGIERILGFRLPESARNYYSWWANERKGRHTQARAWLSAGWSTTEVDLTTERVTFLRNGSIQEETVQSSKRPAESRKVQNLSLRSLEDVEAELQGKVEAARADARDRRMQRLEKANPYPQQITVTTKAFYRNPDVIAEVLKQAKGKCQRCRKKAPFKRRSNGEPYLEVHHSKPLAEGGQDLPHNAMALCPNCHRELHHG